MKKTGVLNTQLSQTIAALGHGDMLVIADAGLPIPKGVLCIDLAVTLGVPTLKQVLDAVLQEVHLEKITLADATSQHRPQLWQHAHEQAQQHDWLIQIVDHDMLKTASAQAAPSFVPATTHPIPTSFCILECHFERRLTTFGGDATHR